LVGYRTFVPLRLVERTFHVPHCGVVVTIYICYDVVALHCCLRSVADLFPRWLLFALLRYVVTFDLLFVYVVYVVPVCYRVTLRYRCYVTRYVVAPLFVGVTLLVLRVAVTLVVVAVVALLLPIGRCCYVVYVVVTRYYYITLLPLRYCRFTHTYVVALFVVGCCYVYVVAVCCSLPRCCCYVAVVVRCCYGRCLLLYSQLLIGDCYVPVAVDPTLFIVVDLLPTLYVYVVVVVTFCYVVHHQDVATPLQPPPPTTPAPSQAAGSPARASIFCNRHKPPYGLPLSFHGRWLPSGRHAFRQDVRTTVCFFLARRCCPYLLLYCSSSKPRYKTHGSPISEGPTTPVSPAGLSHFHVLCPRGRHPSCVVRTSGRGARSNQAHGRLRSSLRFGRFVPGILIALRCVSRLYAHWISYCRSHRGISVAARLACAFRVSVHRWAAQTPRAGGTLGAGTQWEPPSLDLPSRLHCPHYLHALPHSGQTDRFRQHQQDRQSKSKVERTWTPWFGFGSHAFKTGSFLRHSGFGLRFHVCRFCFRCLQFRFATS